MRLPQDPRLRCVTGLAGMHLYPLRHNEGGIESNTELPDKLGVLFLVT